MRSRIITTSTILGIILSSQVVFAQETPTAETPAAATTEAAQPQPSAENDKEVEFNRLVDEAYKAYKENRLEEAEVFFKNAYAIRKKPNILYNLGRIQERQNKLDEAIKTYDAFMIDPDADISRKQDALNRRRILAEAVKNISKEEPKQGIVAKPQPAASEGAGAGPWVLVGIGGASIVTSLILIGVTNGHHKDFEDEANTVSERKDAQSKGANTALLADITMVAGVGAAMGGLIWYMVASGDEKSAQNNTIITPVIGQNHMGVQFDMRF